MVEIEKEEQPSEVDVFSPDAAAGIVQGRESENKLPYVDWVNKYFFFDPVNCDVISWRRFSKKFWYTRLATQTIFQS